MQTFKKFRSFVQIKHVFQLGNIAYPLDAVSELDTAPLADGFRQHHHRLNGPGCGRRNWSQKINGWVPIVNEHCDRFFDFRHNSCIALILQSV
jgi:hypothetical protein